MNVDHAFVIGNSHKVCEDYARSGNRSYPNVELGYAFISDGCSGSDDSDVGARVLVASAEQFLLRRGRISDINDIREIISSAASIQRLMGMDEVMLDATLLGVSVDNRVRVFGIGDGVIACKLRSGGMVAFDLEAPSGYPLYASYLLSTTRRMGALEATYGHLSCGWKVDMVRWGKESLKGDEVFFSSVVDLFSHVYPVEDGRNIEAVAVFSDGVKTFVDESRKEVPWADVVRELMAFKGYKGQFAKRRLQGFLRACAKRGWKHDDDVSIGAVYLGE